MRLFLLSLILLSAQLCLASGEVIVKGADMTYNASLTQVDIQTPPQPVSSIFIYNDNGNGNVSLEGVQISTVRIALSKIFSWNEASINDWRLEPGSIPTKKEQLRRIFSVHEFAGYYKDLYYPKALFNDTAPPKIENIAIDKIGSSQARINWTTDEFARGLVKCGSSTGSLETGKRGTLFTRNHSISLDGLMPGKKYYFAVNCTDRSGNSAESQQYDFETLI